MTSYGKTALLHVDYEEKRRTIEEKGFDFNPIPINCNVKISSTESHSLSSEYSENDDLNRPLTDKLIKEINGVITRVGPETVEVKLDSETFVFFPKVLFTDKSVLKYGQPVKYQIKETPSGIR